jgi:cation diffusion facilitator family transporter
VSEIYKIEQLCLKISSWVNFLCAISCAIIGIYVNSGAVVFDSFYCFFLSIGSTVLIFMSKKSYAPPSKNFQYGYSKFEPLMVFIQAAIVLVSCIYAGLTAARDLIYPNELSNFFIIILLEFFLLLISISMYLICQSNARRYRSRILKVQAISWWADVLQSLLLFLAFSFGSISDAIHLHWLTPYVDPIALIFLVISVIREPAYFLRKSLIELLDGISPGKTFYKVEALIKEFLFKHHFKITNFRFRKAGRRLYIRVMLSPRTDINLLELARVQRDLNHELETTLLDYVFEAVLVVDDRKIDR